MPRKLILRWGMPNWSLLACDCGTSLMTNSAKNTPGHRPGVIARHQARILVTIRDIELDAPRQQGRLNRAISGIILSRHGLYQ